MKKKSLRICKITPLALYWLGFNFLSKYKLIIYRMIERLRMSCVPSQCTHDHHFYFIHFFHPKGVNIWSIGKDFLLKGPTALFVFEGQDGRGQQHKLPFFPPHRNSLQVSSHNGPSYAWAQGSACRGPTCELVKYLFQCPAVLPHTSPWTIRTYLGPSMIVCYCFSLVLYRLCGWLGYQQTQFNQTIICVQMIPSQPSDCQCKH